MRMLICTIGSKRRKSTLRFATEVAKALSGRVTLLGVVSDEKDKDTLHHTLDKAAKRLEELGITAATRVPGARKAGRHTPGEGHRYRAVRTRNPPRFRYLLVPGASPGRQQDLAVPQTEHRRISHRSVRSGKR